MLNARSSRDIRCAFIDAILMQVFMQFGLPRIIATDQRTEFEIVWTKN